MLYDKLSCTVKSVINTFCKENRYSPYMWTEITFGDLGENLPGKTNGVDNNVFAYGEKRLFYGYMAAKLGISVKKAEEYINFEL